MAKIRTFNGTIQNIEGKKRFVPDHPALWQHRISQCKNGQICQIDFREKTRVRSLSQNSLYWIYLDVIEAETGNDTETLHKLFKKKFLPYKITELYGEKILKLTSTTELDSTDFTEYLMKIESLTGIPIPDTKQHKEDRDSAKLL